MIIIDCLFFGLITFLVSYNLWWSKMARSTRELSKLNKIWEDFNNGQTPKNINIQLNNINWKYHKDKIETLKKFIKYKQESIKK